MKSKKRSECILITGAAGFTGRTLHNFLNSETDSEIFCVDRVGDNCCDLTDKDEVSCLIQKIKPTQIYHLAGSFTNDFETDYRVNVLTTKNIFDAVLENDLNARILIIGSAAEYGAVTDGPVAETSDLHPLSIYGLTKTFQTQLMNYYFSVFGVNVVMARTFNLYGEGVSPHLLAGRIQEQIGQCLAGEVDEVVVDDLLVQRDFLHISDAVRYYHRIMHFGVAGEVYNVGSGIPRTAQDLIVEILGKAQMNAEHIRLVERGQKAQIPKIYADIRKLETL